MKYFYPIPFVIMLLSFGCKKDDKNSPKNRIATIKKTILGKWYYNGYEVTYYDKNKVQIYNDVASAVILHNNPHYDLRKNDTAYYTDSESPDPYYAISFTVTSSTAAGDSLIFSGNNHALRFKITAINDSQLQLQSDYPSQTDFVNRTTGQVITSTSASSFGTFSRVKAP